MIRQVVLDMDETMLHCFSDPTPEEIKTLMSIPSLANRVYSVEMRDVLEPAGAGVVDVMYGIERPHLQQFLRYIGQRFDRCVVWSAGQQDYVYSHIAHITRYNPGLFDMVWHYGDCTQNPDGILTKPLAKLYTAFPDMSPDTTFIVDDRETAFSYDNPLNGMLIPAYEPTIEELVEHARAGTPEDVALLQLIHFLEDEKDVRDITKTDIFVPMNNKTGVARILPHKRRRRVLFLCPCGWN